MQLCLVVLLILVAICHGKSTNTPKDDPNKMDAGLKEDSACKGKLCPVNKSNIKPRSCVDHLKNGANRCGYYKIYDTVGNGFTVYCDLETEPGAAWTLVVSWSLKNKGFSSFRSSPLSVNDPVNENSPNWFLYRLTSDRMKSLKHVSTHWRATCSFDKYGINQYKDYVRGRFAAADILAYLGSGICLKTELVNIRGHIGIHKTVRFWQVVNAYFLHTDSSLKGCQFDPTVGSISSEDNFGYYNTVNPKFTCTMNGDSTTQWWFGGYQ